MAEPGTISQFTWSLGQLGLGALGGAIFGAFAQIYIASRNRRHEIERETLKRRQEALENFRVCFEPVHRDVVEASVLVSEWSRFDESEKINLNLREKLRLHFLKINEGVQQLQPEEGRLLLYGLPAAAATLSNYRKLLFELLPKLKVDSVDQDAQIIRDKLLECAHRRTEMYGRLWSALNGDSDRKLPQAYRTDHVSPLKASNDQN